METAIIRTDFEFAHCPVPPLFEMDWDAMVEHIPLITALKGVEQSPIYHGEGDVFVHTKMVLDELLAMENWRQLAPSDRALVFVACLFHDIGKEPCTFVAEDGRIKSPKHAVVGEKMFRAAAMRGELEFEMTFEQREHIAQLIRYHGLPLWIMEKQEPERAIIKASFGCRLDLVAVVAEADLRGRICPDKAHFLERVELFLAYAREQECEDQPREFHSEHSRIQYFRNWDLSAGYQAYDDTKGEVVLLMGLPGCGKDTYIQKHYPDLPVISLDAIRKELKLPHGKNQGRVIQESREQAKKLLRAGQPFVWNATNLFRDRRSPLIDLFTDYGWRTKVVYLEHEFNDLLRRNRNRPEMEQIPEKYLRKAIDRIEMPSLSEAHVLEFVVTG
jgi:putative nucleotidyltransferase with HDIG domain